MNHQDNRHEVEHPTDSSVVAATHSLSDSEILPDGTIPNGTIPNQSPIKMTIILSKNMILGKKNSVITTLLWL